jgi:hypothetical protein
MKVHHKKLTLGLVSLCLVATPLAHGITTLIGNGIHGGELETSTTSNWNPGNKIAGGADTVEYRIGNNLIATAGSEWIDSASADITQNIINTNLFNIGPDTLVTLNIDFSRWEFGAGTRPEALVHFYLGATLLGTIYYELDTNGADQWTTFTATDVAVAEGTGQAFRMETVTKPGFAASGSTQGFALDNVRLTSVPEPSTSLLGVAALGLFIGRRRRP